MNKQEVGIGRHSRSGATRPSVSSCDVERVRAMAAMTRIADCRMIAKGLIGVRGTQCTVDLIPREDPTVSVAIGVRRIVPGYLIPKRRYARRAVGIEKIRVSEIQSEVECRNNASSTRKRQGPSRSLYDLLRLHSLRRMLATVVNSHRSRCFEAQDVRMKSNRPSV